MSRSLWPSTAEPRAWLLCTAAWALRIPCCAEDRCYLGFALGALAERGHRADVKRLAAAALDPPCRRDLSRAVEAHREVIAAWRALGDPAQAAKMIDALAAVGAAQRRADDREYVMDEVEALRKPPAKRVRKERAPSAAALVKRGQAALRELQPEEWNLHHPADDLAEVVRELAAARRRADATRLLDAAVARFEAGGLDGRGFASAAAYASLAEAALIVRGAAAARSLVERALALAGRQRKMVIGSVVVTLAAAGEVDQALALARRSGGDRAELAARVLARAGRWKEIPRTLAPITAPAKAAKVAWGLARTVMYGDH